MLTVAQLQDILKSMPTGYLSANDEFFQSTNEFLLPKYKKLGVLIDAIDEEIDTALTSPQKSPNSSTTEVYCHVPSCRRYFDSVASYQTHFNSIHRYICAQCKKSLPTPHLLDLHLSEQHDSYFAARVTRGEAMYACYLETCTLRFQTPAARKQHCIETHKFPANFRFDQLRAAAVQPKKPNAALGEHMEQDVVVYEGKAQKKSASKQKQVFCFGHQKSKTFNARTQRKSVDGDASLVEGATLENLSSLQQALESMS